MVTSINGNNVTWRDSKTGNLITDTHSDLELINSRRNNMPYHTGRTPRRNSSSRNTTRRNNSMTPRRNSSSRNTTRRNTTRRNNSMTPQTPNYSPPSIQSGQGRDIINPCGPGRHMMSDGKCMDDSAMSGYNSNQSGGTPPPPTVGSRNAPRNNRRRRTTQNNPRSMASRGQQLTQRESGYVQQRRTQPRGRRTVSPRQSGVRRQIQSNARYYLSNGDIYTGRTFEQNGIIYTTRGGTMEGDSRELSRRKI